LYWKISCNKKNTAEENNKESINEAVNSSVGIFLSAGEKGVENYTATYN